MFNASRCKTGKTVTIYVDAKDTGRNAKIAELKLYEDGNLITEGLVFNGKSFKNSYKHHGIGQDYRITHEKPGVHVYRAEVVDIDGNRAHSKEFSVEFTAKKIDDM